MTAALLLALTLAGCDAPAPQEGSASYATPADGQSGVGLEASLVVVAPDLDLPPDYPVPPIIRVVDLHTGGFLEGDIEVLEDGLVFTPGRPWRSNSRYAWTVDLVEDLPHGPQASPSVPLLHDAVFDTAPTLAALAAGTGDGVLCVVLSRPVSGRELAEMQLVVNDVPVLEPQLERLPREQWELGLDARTVGDRGLDVVCAEEPADGLLRVITSQSESSLVEISDEGAASLVGALYGRRP